MGFMGYRCEYEPGYKQMHVGDEANFLPCVIPNCKNKCHLKYAAFDAFMQLRHLANYLIRNTVF
ncbi:hypothetical protein [Oryza sativa Japonica Group]|uniref:Uncharacterized protein n=1 Tax=Oryza sativa subsp. japonica TaxID=39947 RepID=Q5QLU6_ORYSJ|nr:hypothetical protein [Oryza sativa Japonica Group]